MKARSCALFLAVALVPGTSAVSGAKRMVVVPHDGARWAPADPARPEGTQVAVLSGDPATGPSSMLMKMKKTDGGSTCTRPTTS